MRKTISIVLLSAVLISCLREGSLVFNFLTKDEIVYIGLISYSLYLWHWGVLSISRWTIGIHWWSAPFQITLMFGLAVASYRWVETPLREGNWFGKRWKTYGARTSLPGTTTTTTTNTGFTVTTTTTTTTTYD